MGIDVEKEKLKVKEKITQFETNERINELQIVWSIIIDEIMN